MGRDYKQIAGDSTPGGSGRGWRVRPAGGTWRAGTLRLPLPSLPLLGSQTPVPASGHLQGWGQMAPVSPGSEPDVSPARGEVTQVHLLLRVNSKGKARGWGGQS